MKTIMDIQNHTAQIISYAHTKVLATFITLIHNINTAHIHHYLEAHPLLMLVYVSKLYAKSSLTLLTLIDSSYRIVVT